MEGIALTHALGGKRRWDVAIHPRLYGGPQAVALADSDCEDERHGCGVDPFRNKRIEEHDNRVALVVPVIVRESEERDIDEAIETGDEVEYSRDEEENCGLPI